jgi:hypothetical protein
LVLEPDFLRAIADTLDCPIPPFVQMGGPLTFRRPTISIATQPQTMRGWGVTLTLKNLLARVC